MRTVLARAASAAFCTLSVLGCGGTSVVLRFPADADLGQLTLVEDPSCFTCGNGEEEAGRATGERRLSVPEGWYVLLRMQGGASRHMAALEDPSLAHLGALDLSGSDVTDADLVHLAGIPLESLNLSHTRIDGSGLAYVRADPRWLSLDLSDCPNLRLENLAPLRSTRRMSVQLAPPIWAEMETPAARAMRARAADVLCPGEDEHACGIQIR